MAKDKKEKRKSAAEETEDKGESYETLVSRVNQVANPIAPRKLNKKVLKMVKKGRGVNKNMFKGLKEVQKAFRKNKTGFLVLAGDIFPIDIMAHLPAMCEERSIPYIYTPSRAELGLALGSRRSTCCVFVESHEDYKELFDEVVTDVKALPSSN